MKIKLTTKVLHGCLLMSFSASTLAGIQNTKINTSLVPTLEGDPKVDFQLARVGWHLFRDPKLSSNGKISCETCHNLSTNGAEQTQVSTGVHGVGTRNSISVFNAALNYRFLWDGTANSLMVQIDGPVQNPLEMDSNWGEIEKHVQANSLYKFLFEQTDKRINVTNIKRAIVEFVKGLQTPSSPFDAYLRGDTNVMNEQSIRGWKAFQQVGCVQCHQGRNIGGSMIQQFSYFQTREKNLDTGRHLRTSDGEDKSYFRVASLRNVGQTGPYFHNGQVDKLSDAIQIMSQVLQGVTMSDDKVVDIEAFLMTLSTPRPAILEVFENE